ncbi:beta-lactamase/transpeptidase-like protein [Mucidula mucida]|nr:beta-lactamase/transpeptidase-like protein [Mucidula mucida]
MSREKMPASEKRERVPPTPSRLTKRRLLGVLSVCPVLLIGYYASTMQRSPAALRKAPLPRRCSPPLPNLLAQNAIEATDPLVKGATASLDAFFSARASEDDIDSISVSIVTPFGPIFESSYGVLRANESDQGTVDRHSIYRIASITKMFTVLETLIMREKGALNWDDPVTKFIPEFEYPAYDWIDLLEGVPTRSKKKPAPITLRQLSSHMAGISRDYPTTNFASWPHVSKSEALPVTHFVDDFHTTELEVDRPAQDILTALAKKPLVTLPYSFPIYSNTGMDLLGLSNLGAERLVNKSTITHNEMVKRDIFEPLGLNGSFYGQPKGVFTARVAVPALDFAMADHVFNVSSDPSGGQYSSLADLVQVMQSLLAPDAHGGVVSDSVIREWLRPLHGWSDGFLEVGAPWEIIKLNPGVRLYSKGGNLPGYHSQFSINPQYSYGVIVLVTGSYADTVTLALEATALFQPVFEQLQAEMAAKSYAGVWKGDDSVAIIDIVGGVLYLQLLVVEGVDVLSLVSTGKPVALWSTGRSDEFRIAFGRSAINDTPFTGCEPYWISFDDFMGHNVPADLLYFAGNEVVYPSANVRLRRI